MPAATVQSLLREPAGPPADAVAAPVVLRDTGFETALAEPEVAAAPEMLNRAPRVIDELF